MAVPFSRGRTLMVMRPRVGLALAACLLALAPAASAPAQERRVQDENSLLIASQNTLHLSDSQKGKVKRSTFKTQFDKYDLTLLQEVMKSADLKTVTPGSYLVQDTGLKGASSYKERYAIIYSSVLTAKNPGKYMVDYTGKGAKKFARTPSGTLIEDDEGELIWFVDFHAIFGKSVELRRTEAKMMADVYEWFDEKTTWGSTNKTILAGDWNLPAGDKGFAALKKINSGSMQILPNVKSSLTRAGAPSEPYDHFVTDGDNVDLRNCRLIDLPSGMTAQKFRTQVSDHRGIRCTAAYDVDSRR